MPRPKNKSELLTAIEKEYGALNAHLDTLSADQMLEPDVVGVWSVKDVLAHLYEWIEMCLGWYQAGLDGETPTLPASGFKWNQIPALNQQIYEKHCNRPLDDVVTEFHKAADKIHALIEELSNEALFTSGIYPWTKKNALGTYMISNTSGHYAWARKEIRKGFQKKRQ